MRETFIAHVQRSRVLQLLIAVGGRGATTADISSPATGGHEGPRRVRELRALGYPIRCRPLDNGWWLYWLRQPGEPWPGQMELFP